MIGIGADCKGCIKTIIPNSWFFWLERVAWIHFYKLFWSSSSGTCVSSWRSSDLFTLSCLGMNIFISTFPWSLRSLSTSTSCHSGNTLLCKETVQCRSTTSGLILIPHYNAITLSLRCTLGDKIDNAIAEENDSTNRLGRINHSTHSKFWRPILELEYNQTPKKWRQAQMQATKKLPSKCKHQDRANGLCRKMPWNRKIDFDLECLNYHNRGYTKWQRCYLSVSEQKFGK